MLQAHRSGRSFVSVPACWSNLGVIVLARLGRNWQFYKLISESGVVAPCTGQEGSVGVARACHIARVQSPRNGAFSPRSTPFRTTGPVQGRSANLPSGVRTGKVRGGACFSHDSDALHSDESRGQQTKILAGGSVRTFGSVDPFVTIPEARGYDRISVLHLKTEILLHLFTSRRSKGMQYVY